MRTAIVTGASRGIGRACAITLATQGLAVVVNYAGSDGEAAQVVSEIENAGSRALAVQADVASASDVARLFDQAEAAFAGIDVVVSSAGVMTTGHIAEVGDD